MKQDNKELIENIIKERQQKRLEKKKAYDEQVAKQLEIKNERKESKKKLKTEIKNKKKKIKEIKKEKHQLKINATKEIKDKKELSKRLDEIKGINESKISSKDWLFSINKLVRDCIPFCIVSFKNLRKGNSTKSSSLVEWFRK